MTGICGYFAAAVRRESVESPATSRMRPAVADRVRSSAFGHRWL